MTPEDVAAVLSVLRAGYPQEHPHIDDATIAVWHSILSGYRAEVVLDVAMAAVRSRPKFPAVADLLEDVLAAMKRERWDAEAAQRALPSPPPDPPPPGMIAALREALRRGPVA